MTLITPEYQALNRQHHDEWAAWGTGAKHYVDVVRDLATFAETTDVLDYGCGKGSLGQALGYAIQEYDPAVPSKDHLPKPAEIVVCASVLEHVEPICLRDVLDHLRHLTKRYGLFIIPHNPSIDDLPDGRNAHLNVQSVDWWRDCLKNRGFKVLREQTVGSITSSRPGEVMLGSKTFFLVS